MSNLNEYYRKLKKSDREFFFGEVKETSNKYFTFNHVISNDEIIIITENIHEIKGNLVLIVDNNKAVYLKNWQVKGIMNYYNGIYAFAVKLNRKYFKSYTFKNEFKNVHFETEDTFDTLLEVAKEQDQENMEIATGWGKADIQWNMSKR
ncbi:hypothetical protein [Peptostreptococcus anaerobius]|uniref:hypothetical protein n=1 Tax=Peptostreptococcus anaerobius TaxID=1261 RepID=UPI0034A40CD1